MYYLKDIKSKWYEYFLYMSMTLYKEFEMGGGGGGKKGGGEVIYDFDGIYQYTDHCLIVY